jgi:hypothetical protein
VGANGKGGKSSSGGNRVASRGTQMKTIPMAAALYLLKRRLPPSPQLFLAKQVLGHMYKRRFSIKNALMRSPAERAFAILHHMRIAYMHELFASAAEGKDIGLLVVALERIEASWRSCEEYVLGGRGVSGIVGKAGAFATTEKLCKELGKADFVVEGKWDTRGMANVEDLMRSAAHF